MSPMSRHSTLAPLYRRSVDEPKALNEARREVRSASGRVVSAQRGVGDEALIRAEDGDKRVWRIGTQASAWVLASPEAVFNAGAAESDDLDEALGTLVDVRLDRLEITKAWALVLVLEGDRWLEVEARLGEPQPPADDPPYWEVFTPEGLVLSVGPGSWWGLASSRDEPESLEPTIAPRHEAEIVDSTPLAQRDLPQLLTLWADLTRELEKRGAIRRTANVLGDMAEELVRLRYGGFRGSYERSGWDVLTRDGQRLEVKAIKGERAVGRRLSISSENYDALVVVAFTDQYLVPTAWRIPRDVAERHVKSPRATRKDEHRRAYLSLTRALLDSPGVEQVDLSSIVGR